MKKVKKVRVFAENRNNMLDIFVKINSETYFVTTRRRNTGIWYLLKDGISYKALKVLKKPSSNRHEQHFYKSVKYLDKVIADFIKFDLEIEVAV